jgi:hypothetical protein
MLGPRFTIRRLMIAVPVIAVALVLLQQYTYSTLITLYLLGLASIAWFPNRGRSRAASWAFFLTAAWLNLSLPTFYAYYPALHDEMLLFLGSLIFVPIVPGAGIAWVATRQERPRRIRAALVVLALTALPASMIATRWPLYLGFYLSRPSLERLADRLEAGGVVAPGEWAGIYRVWGTIPGFNPGEIGLLIDPDTSGQFAFVRRRAPLIGRPPGPEGVDGVRWYSIDQD